MIFSNAGTSKLGPIIDERLKAKITISTTTEIPHNIAFLMDLGIKAVVQQLEKEEMITTVMPVQILVTDQDTISLEFLDDEFATVVSLIMYPIHRWIDRDLSEIVMLTCVVEEFAHFYWNIQDEVEVNYKVLEIIQNVMPETTMGTLYDTEWMEENEK